MTQPTTMTVYRDVVLECQRCFTICRYAEAAVRHNCPACGRAIANWDELAAALNRVSAPASQPSATPQSSSSRAS
jgi:predicted RNA-binding Zn-ribbon protein involved in translation (DUF1610 family)